MFCFCVNAYVQKPKPAPKPVQKDTAAIREFKKYNNVYYVTKTVRVDKIAYANGMWQMYSNELAGGKGGSWTNNGVPLAMVNNVTRGNVAPTKVGDKVKIMIPFNYGEIDKYHNASNGVGIYMSSYGIIWLNADTLLEL